MRNIFVSVTGQDDNLGDSVLRREMLKRLRGRDVRLHLHTGDNTAGYLENVVDYTVDSTYRSRKVWYTKMVACKPSSVDIVLNPGERNLMRGQSYLGRYQGALFGNLVARGAQLIQTGVGIRNPGETSGMESYAVLKKFRLVAWRDSLSRDAAAIGRVCPDWALSYASQRPNFVPKTNRKFLAIALRGDRPAPAAEWIKQVELVCQHTNLTPIVVVQVKRDHEVANQIAEALSCEITRPWIDSDHAEQEKIVREVYAKSAAVVSDRLHALIFGITEGAIPIAWSPNSTEKCVRTLASAGFPNPKIASDLEPLGEVERMLKGFAETQKSLNNAKRELDLLVDTLNER